MTTHRILDVPQSELTLGPGAATWFRAFLVLGTVGLLSGFALAAWTDDGWSRFLPAYLTSWIFFLSLAIGALFFTLVQHASRAGWSVVVRRLAEAVAPNVVIPLVVLSAPVLAGLGTLYPWTDPARVAGDELLEAKSAWLNVPFFLTRAALYFLVWGVLAIWFHRSSTRQDRTGDPAATKRMETASTAGLVLFAFSVTFFAFDFLMSLTPHWYSTIFGVYFFAGCVLSFFAFLTLLAFTVERTGRLRHLITTEHYHDLGKLVFAFTVFWAYIGFSQYMLMWYANLPEETVWYKARQTGGWTAFSVALLFGHFLLPFLALLSRGVKRRRALVAAGAVWMIVMQWMDVFWLVRPASSPGAVPFGLMDVATFVGIGGFFLAGMVRRLGRHALIPVGDPRLGESLSFENF